MEYEFPKDIMIEVTNVCNLQCTTCYSHQDGREKKFMDPSLFKKIIDGIPGKELRTISLYNYGEPLMHKDITEMVSYAKKSWVSCVKISTNGHFLSSEMIKWLTYAGLDYLSISIDGVTQEVYQSFRKGGDLSLVLKNTIRCVQFKKKLGYGPIIEIQFIIMKHNEYQLDLIQELAEKIKVDVLRLKTVLVKEKKWDHLLPEDRSKSRYSTKKTNTCFKPIKGMTVNVDGKVIPCCYITGSAIDAYMFWNIEDGDIQDIYRTGSAFLEKVTADKTEISYCSGCEEWNLDLDYRVIELGHATAVH